MNCEEELVVFVCKVNDFFCGDWMLEDGVGIFHRKRCSSSSFLSAFSVQMLVLSSFALVSAAMLRYFTERTSMPGRLYAAVWKGQGPATTKSGPFLWLCLLPLVFPFPALMICWLSRSSSLVNPKF